MAAFVHQFYPLPQSETGPVARRHVLYIQGFFPQGPAYYHNLLRKQLAHHAQLYGLQASCSDLARIGPLIRRCEIAASKDGQSTHTVYDFLDWSDIVEKAHKRSFAYTAARAVLTFAAHFTDGTFYAMLRLCWKFALAWILPYIIFALIGLFAAIAVQNACAIFSDAAPMLAVAKALISALAAAGLWRLARLNWCASMLRSFNYASLYAKGGAPELDQRLEQFGDVIAEACATSDADEILIVGHSFGGQLAVRAAANAARKGAFENNNNRIKLLTMGDAGMHVALMKGPSAAHVRRAVFDIATQADLPWVIIYSGKDAMSFGNADPPSGLKWFEHEQVRVEDFRWPLMYDARFRSMLNEDDYNRLRWRFFHLHGLFIMAARLKSAHFDYLRLVCGGTPLALSGTRISAKQSS